ncbi:MAG TPA: hypothetical protein VGG28_01085 [Kofleriaceae bacterium]|jgi:hypothetical protein
MRIVSLSLVVLAGCYPDQAEELFNGVYPGESSYTATITGNSDGLAGAAPLTTIDDGDASMQLGSDGCALVFEDIQLDTDSRGDASSATAMLDGIDTCTVPVDGGTAVLEVTSGSTTSTGGTSLAVSIGGNLSSWAGSAATGYITVTFQGAWVSD